MNTAKYMKHKKLKIYKRYYFSTLLLNQVTGENIALFISVSWLLVKSFFLIEP